MFYCLFKVPSLLHHSISCDHFVISSFFSCLLKFSTRKYIFIIVCSSMYTKKLFIEGFVWNVVFFIKRKKDLFIWFCGTMVVIFIRGNKCWFILAVCHLGCWRNPEVVGMKHNYLCFDQFLNLYTLLMLNFAINCLYIFTSLLLPCNQCCCNVM